MPAFRSPLLLVIQDPRWRREVQDRAFLLGYIGGREGRVCKVDGRRAWGYAREWGGHADGILWIYKWAWVDIAAMKGINQLWRNEMCMII